MHPGPPGPPEEAALSPSPAAPVATARVCAEWARRVQAEYRSAATAARLAHLAIALGLPEALVLQALAVVRDELAHARLSHGCLAALQADDTGASAPPEAVPLTLADLLPPGDPRPVVEATATTLQAFCFGETLAVPLFAALRAGTTHPRAQAVLDRILRDEQRHRDFGWAMLDALLALDPAGVRAEAQRRIPGLHAAFRASYGGCAPDAPVPDPLLPTERALGLMPLEQWARVSAAALAEEVAPRLAQRGLQLLPSGPRR